MATNLGTILTALSNSGLSGTQLSSAMSSVASALLPTVSSQVTADLTQLASLVNNAEAYKTAAPAIIQKIMTINGLPTTVLPLLNELQTATDPLQISQLIQSIEAMISTQTSILSGL